MRIYKNCMEAVVDLGREFQKVSTEVHTQTMQNKVIAENKDYNTREIQAFSFVILDPSDKDEMPEVTKEWALAEFQERTNDKRENPGQAWKLREDVWKEFINKEGKFDYTYGDRIGVQPSRCMHELLRHPETRQAIIQIHNRSIDDKVMGKKRIPCSMFYQLMKRQGKLDILYVMRSSDFITHFQNDIYLALLMQEYIAKVVDIKQGKFMMFVSSLHCYQKDWEALKKY